MEGQSASGKKNNLLIWLNLRYESVSRRGSNEEVRD